MNNLTRISLIIVCTLSFLPRSPGFHPGAPNTLHCARGVYPFMMADVQAEEIRLSRPLAISDVHATGSPLSQPHHHVPWNRNPMLWHRHFDDAIYTSTGLCEPAGLAFAGTYLNPPRQAEAVPLSGDGTAAWTFEGTTFFVDASREGEVLAAVDHDTADSSAVIMEWRSGSSTPLWSFDVHPCRTSVWQGWASRKPVQVSKDGSTIAVVANMYRPGGQRGRLHVFEAGSGIPVIECDLPEPAGNASATAISAGGEFAAIAAWPNVYVYDCYGQTLRWSGPLAAGNDALAISGDGRYLAWGWSTFYLREWTGSSYDLLWSHTPGSGYYTGQCALTSDGSALAVSWDNGSSFPNEITLDLYELPSLDPIWTYDYANPVPSRLPSGDDPSTGGPPREHVDIPSQMCFSPDGDRLAVASWGGTFPEIHVFDRAGPEPLFILDTPGSMFDIDIITSKSGYSCVTACGKNVHAGQGGRGGDLYAIRIPPPR